MKSKHVFCFILHQFLLKCIMSTYTPKGFIDEIHIAHNDVYRLSFKTQDTRILFWYNRLTIEYNIIYIHTMSLTIKIKLRITN